MATMIERIESRAWVAHVDDERDAGNGYMVMLAKGYDFADEPGCGVRGCDTLREVEIETRRGNVIESAKVSSKYWNVDLTSDELVMNASLTRVPAETSEQAEEVARRLMAAPECWRVVGIDRCLATAPATGERP